MTMKKTLKHAFVTFSKATSCLAGHPGTFVAAMAIIIVWAITGPLFGFNDTWQLVINTGTTIITFLMVFLIQSTQNRDTAAMQIKLDELIRISQGAHTALLDLEELGEEDLERLRSQYEDMAQKARANMEQGKSDILCPNVNVQNIVEEAEEERQKRKHPPHATS